MIQETQNKTSVTYSGESVLLPVSKLREVGLDDVADVLSSDLLMLKTSQLENEVEVVFAYDVDEHGNALETPKRVTVLINGDITSTFTAPE